MRLYGLTPELKEWAERCGIAPALIIRQLDLAAREGLSAANTIRDPTQGRAQPQDRPRYRASQVGGHGRKPV